MKKNLSLHLIVLISLFNTNLIAQTDIKFQTFNVWQEGTSVTNGLTKIRDVILKTNPDIIGFVEVRNYNSEDWTTKIVNLLSASGRTYYRGYANGDVSLISKYPIVSSKLTGAGAVSAFEIKINTNTIVVAVAHLDYTEYACYLPRGYNGGTPDWNMIDDGNGNPKPVTDVNTVLSYNLKSTRDEEIAAFIAYAKAETRPVILMGDFNEPSCLDWISSTTNMFDHNGLVIPWQTTAALKSNGYIDSYREFFPDPVVNPGITWPSFADGKGSTSWTPKSDERDRIDFIFHKGSKITTKYVALVGPKKSYAKNVTTTTYTSKDNFMADSLPWPSDHKALFATLTFPFTTVGIQEHSFADNISVYPNPTEHNFNIVLNGYYSNVHVIISDVLGKTVGSYVYNDGLIPPIELNQPAGVYFVSVYSGNDRAVVKLIKE